VYPPERSVSVAVTTPVASRHRASGWRVDLKVASIITSRRWFRAGSAEWAGGSGGHRIAMLPRYNLSGHQVSAI